MITAVGVDGWIWWVSIAYDGLSAVVHFHRGHDWCCDELIDDLVVSEVVGVDKLSIHHEVTKALRTNKFISKTL